MTFSIDTLFLCTSHVLMFCLAHCVSVCGLQFEMFLLVYMAVSQMVSFCTLLSKGACFFSVFFFSSKQEPQQTGFKIHGNIRIKKKNNSNTFLKKILQYDVIYCKSFMRFVQ